jgi:hypothetical protein
MDSPEVLIASVLAEDRLLQRLLQQCAAEHRELRGPGGTLSFKETLGHLAFWDTFAVHFFLSKLSSVPGRPSFPADFEERSREELRRLRKLPFSEVLDSYQKATMALVEFLRGHWHELSAKERQDFDVPLRHRRHHRLLLDKALTALQKGQRVQKRAGTA